MAKFSKKFINSPEKILLVLIFIGIAALYKFVTAPEKTVLSTPSYQICFTPKYDCTALITQTIQKAQKNILVQAYSFTSIPIAHALAQAKARGVEVKVILDESQVKKGNYSSARFLLQRGIPIWIDYKPAIAHNKVMIIDDNTTVTGSFNFTKAAQFSNTENVLIIQDANIAKAYKENWQNRLQISKGFNEYRPSYKKNRPHFPRGE